MADGAMPFEPEFSRLVAVDSLRGGCRMEIEARPEEREALARRFDVMSLDSLTAKVDLSAPRGRDVVILEARFEADVVQACVVTLEPVASHLAGHFTMTFGDADDDDAPGGDLTLFLDEEDPPQPIVGGMVDVGEAVAEQLALVLDPFPRKPGAVFVPPDSDGAGNSVGRSPFAALAALGPNEKKIGG